MFWMFLINGLGVLIGFGLAFYLLLITQKGDCSEKPELLALVFFVRFLAQLGVKRIIVRSGCPEVPGSWPKKVAELCDCSLCYPAASWSQLLGPGSVLNYCSVFHPDSPVPGSFVHRDLVESANYCSVICPDLPGIRCRCRASESVFGVGTTAQSLASRFFLSEQSKKNIESIRSTYNEHLLLKTCIEYLFHSRISY